MMILLLVACGNAVDSEQIAETPVSARTITLTTTFGATDHADLVLTTGELVAEGDVRLNQTRILSLTTLLPDGVCEKGTYETIEEIPTDLESCPGSAANDWGPILYLGGASIHDESASTVGGLSALVRDDTTVYRLRMISDSYSSDTVSTATFSYIPVP